jgi:uncharacterized membrane protein
MQQSDMSFDREDASIVDVTPNSIVDVEMVSAAQQVQQQQQQQQQRPAWWAFGQRLAKGAAVFALAMALAMAPLAGGAWAARSGGRIGGAGFSAARSGAGSFGGSMAGGMSRGYSGGGMLGGGGMRMAPSVNLMPRTSFGFGGFGGFGGYPGYYGGGYGAPVVSSGGGGGGLFTLLALGVLGYAALQILPRLAGGNDDSGYGRCTVAKVQIGLTGTAVSLKRDLERIAKRADTNTSEGLNFVLQETVLALLRHPEYCQYGAASTKGVRGLDAAEERFNEASMRERCKFEEETFVNVSGRTRNTSDQGRYASRSRGPTGDELIVVTVLVATDGKLDVPNINSQQSLRTTLNRLGSLRSDQVLAVEVLWTPQEEGDTFTRDELMTDYPKLNTL